MLINDTIIVFFFKEHYRLWLTILIYVTVSLLYTFMENANVAYGKCS